MAQGRRDNTTDRHEKNENLLEPIIDKADDIFDAAVEAA